LSGGIDFTADITTDQLKQIKRIPRLNGVEAETMRISYLGFDAAGRSGATPMQNLKVRQAIAHAINRQAITAGLVGGDSKVVDTPCFPTQFGCDASAATRWSYDPARAKALLAEAGFANGLNVEFYNYRSPSWAEAIIGDLAKVGITAKLNQLGYFALRDLQHKSGSTPLFLMDWGSLSINDMSAITSKFFTHGPDDFAKDPELKAWLEAGDSASDPAVRKENYRRAIERITSQLYWLPMFSHVRSYAYVKDLNFIGYVDEIPRFYAYSWK
jgi:peptide/nickel transport system substrate-binding protein